MDGTHHAVGQSRAEFIDILQPSRLLDLAVEGLQIVLRQPIQWNVADVRDDVQVVRSSYPDCVVARMVGLQ